MDKKDKKAKRGEGKRAAAPSSGEDYRFDIDEARTIAAELVSPFDIPSSWERMAIEGTIAYAVQTWCELGNVWVALWDRNPRLPSWEPLDDRAKTYALTKAAYEHFVADVDLMGDRFEERMMPSDPDDALEERREDSVEGNHAVLVTDAYARCVWARAKTPQEALARMEMLGRAGKVARIPKDRYAGTSFALAPELDGEYDPGIDELYLDDGLDG